MLALVPVRDGVLPAGADEAIAECGGRVLIAGSGTADVPLDGIATEVVLVELGDLEPARWARLLQPVLTDIDDHDVLVLPNSPDGRDLAPRIAVALDRPLLAGATEISTHRVRVARRGASNCTSSDPPGRSSPRCSPAYAAPTMSTAHPPCASMWPTTTAHPWPPRNPSTPASWR